MPLSSLGSLGALSGLGHSLPQHECGSRSGSVRPLCRRRVCPSWHIHGPSSQSQSESGGLGWSRPVAPRSLPVKPETQKMSPGRVQRGPSDLPTPGVKVLRGSPFPSTSRLKSSALKVLLATIPSIFADPTSSHPKICHAPSHVCIFQLKCSFFPCASSSPY